MAYTSRIFFATQTLLLKFCPSNLPFCSKKIDQTATVLDHMLATKPTPNFSSNTSLEALFYWICLPPGFLPVLGPTDR